MEVFDKDGNPVEGVFTQAELDAKLAAEKAAWEEAQKQNTPPTPPASTEPPEWFKPFAEKVDKLAGNQTTMVVQDITTGLDAEQRESFNKKFESLSGYGDTPEELQRRAQDAYLLATGQRYEENAINLNNLTATTGVPVRPTATSSGDEKAIQQVFGITDEDVNKYGNK